MQKLRFPVDFVGITNGYSSNHQAIDLGWHDKQDEPIYACADGKVSKIWEDTQFGGGLTLTIEYNNGYKSDFKHLSKVLVSEGQVVTQGQEVAIMGNTGWASAGTHLHYNCYKNGIRVNPLEYTYLYPNQEVCDSDKDKVMIYKQETNHDIEYIVQKGDTLTSIAQKYNTTYQKLAEYNNISNPNLILIGQVIKIPNNSKIIYTVQKGDTLSSIASKYNITWQKIYEDNKSVIGDNPDLIKPGQELKIG